MAAEKNWSRCPSAVAFDWSVLPRNNDSNDSFGAANYFKASDKEMYVRKEGGRNI